QQVDPAVPSVEMQMCTVEESAIVLRESSQQDVPAKPGVSAVGQRGEKCAARGESVPAGAQEDQGIAQVLQNVCAEDVVETTAQRRKSIIQIGGNKLDSLGRVGSREIDGSHVEPAGGEDLR